MRADYSGGSKFARDAVYSVRESALARFPLVSNNAD